MAKTIKMAIALLKTGYGYFVNAKDAYDCIKGALEEAGLIKSESDELKEHITECFLSFRQQLSAVQQNLTDVIHDTHTRNQYKEYEAIIHQALDAFINYEKASHDKSFKQEFLSIGEPKLRNAVQMLMKGLLGEFVLHFDILQVIGEHEKYRPGKMRKRIRPIVELINTGLMLHSAFVQVAKIPDKSNDTVADALTALYNQVTDKIEKKIKEYEDEVNVPAEIKEILNREKSSPTLLTTIFWSSSDPNGENVTKNVYDFLAEKYDSRQWVVILYYVLDSYIFAPYKKEQWLTDGVGFHHVGSVNDRKILAKSFPLDKNPPAPIKLPDPLPNATLWQMIGSYFTIRYPEDICKIVASKEPRNDYLVTQIHNTRHRRKVVFLPPVVFPKNSPLVLRTEAVSNFHVVAIPK